MKCALIIPSWVPEDLFPAKTAASQINYWQPLGTLYVGATLIEARHEVRFYNGAFMRHEEILQELLDFAPELVGIYSTTFGWKRAIKTAKAIKTLDKNMFICVGGPYPTAMQECCLNDDTTSIDAVVVGEAEQTMPELAARISQNQSFHGLLGLIYREGNKVIKNSPRLLNEDLDELPFPARHLLGKYDEQYIPPPATYKRKPVAVIITARGCDRRCIFCSQFDKKRKSGRRGIRYRNVDSVLEEIELCLKQGYKEIKFIDDTFAADYDRAMQISKEIIARRLDFTWFASACVNQVDKKLLQVMKDAGCWAILFGGESGVQKNVNILRKGFKIEHTRAAVKAAKEVGLKVSVPFVIGIPGETYDEAIKTINFAIELDPDFANFHALTPFPGTPLHDNIEKYGTVTSELEDFTYQSAAFVPYTMTRQQIHELRQLAFKRFYGRPSFILKRILQTRSWNDCVASARGAKSLFWVLIKSRIFNKQRHTSVVNSN